MPHVGNVHRVVEFTFKDVGREQLQLTQTVVSTGEVYSLDDYVMVKVCEPPESPSGNRGKSVFYSTNVSVPRCAPNYGRILNGSLFDE